MNAKIKHILTFIIAATLFLPMIQLKFCFIEVAPLQGGVSVAAKPEFKKEDYWSLYYQENYNKYINDNFGFRPLLVRLVNQARFSLFNATNAPGVVIGKDGELFIESYIDDYIGRNFIGKNKIAQNVTKIKCVQDSLKSRGIDLIVVFAPGKASFHPELIPDTYLQKKKDSTNYLSYADLLTSNKINFIDLNKWFYLNKPKFKHPIYPKYGTHWNHYGMTLALDSITKFIEKKRQINLPDFDYSLINYNTDLKGNDFDIGILMNLLVPIEKDPLPYPVYKFKKEIGFTKPNVLVVGDSYWWCPVGDNLPIRFFQEDEYWFYNKDQLIQNEKRKKVKELNFSASIAQRHVIILMATEATFYMFPYGFIDNAYTLYCQNNSKRLNEIIENIKKNTEWYNSIIIKAEENKVSTVQQLKLDAEYILSDELLKPIESLESVIERIKADPLWMKEIENKSKENHILIEEQIRRDAQWTIDNQK